jgi:hypothetical protein
MWICQIYRKIERGWEKRQGGGLEIKGNGRREQRIAVQENCRE